MRRAPHFFHVSCEMLGWAQDRRRTEHSVVLVDDGLLCMLRLYERRDYFPLYLASLLSAHDELDAASSCLLQIMLCVREHFTRFCLASGAPGKDLRFG